MPANSKGCSLAGTDFTLDALNFLDIPFHTLQVVNKLFLSQIISINHQALVAMQLNGKLVI